MNTLRSLLFTLWLYLSMAVLAVGLSPALLMPHRAAMGVVKLWARTALFGLRWIAGVKVEFRGLEHAPSGAALVATKHQGMLDNVALLAVLPERIYFGMMKYERVILIVLLAAVWGGFLDGPLSVMNNVVWDLLDNGTQYIDTIAYSAYYASAGTVI